MAAAVDIPQEQRVVIAGEPSPSTEWLQLDEQSSEVAAPRAAVEVVQPQLHLGRQEERLAEQVQAAPSDRQPARILGNRGAGQQQPKPCQQWHLALQLGDGRLAGQQQAEICTQPCRSAPCRRSVSAQVLQSQACQHTPAAWPLHTIAYVAAEVRQVKARASADGEECLQN